MSDITLSAGVRQNLLSLQSTASLLSTTQEALATGKKVNSAADNPSNFFTSQSLNNRANDLSSLLNLIGQAQQTITQADTGITSLTNLVQSAKSLATQAQQSTLGAVNFSQVTGTQAIAADTTEISGSTAVATAVSGVVASTQSTASISSAGITALANGDTLTFKLGASGTVQTATFTTGSASGSSFNTAADLQTLLNADFSGKAVATVASGAVTLTSDDLTNDFTTGGTNGAGTNFAAAAHTTGDALTLTDGSGHSSSFFFVAGNASAANGTFTTAANLVSAISNGASSVHGTITPTGVGASNGFLQLDSPGSITVAGNIGTALGLTTGTTNANFNSTLHSLTGSISVQVGSNTTHTVTFGSGNGQVNTKAALTAAFNGFTDITAGFNSSGDLQFTPTSTSPVTVGGTPGTVTSLGLSLGTFTPTATVVSPNSTRANLQTQYNDLLTQIDQLAGDSSYNGINLLNGDNLKVTFNESGTSSLTIQGVKFNSQGLGLSAVTGTGFQDNNNINNTISNLNTALTSLRSQAASFGSNLSTVQTRQDFTKDLVNTLQSGASNLVLADTNQEGANLLALQTRQQLAITSLSLASQADQAILKIL